MSPSLMYSTCVEYKRFNYWFEVKRKLEGVEGPVLLGLAEGAKLIEEAQDWCIGKMNFDQTRQAKLTCRMQQHQGSKGGEDTAATDRLE